MSGGGSGIGRAVCKAFGYEGAKVVVADIDEAAAKLTAESLSGRPYTKICRPNVKMSDKWKDKEIILV